MTLTQRSFKVWDCVTFFNENDLLELRMQELDGLVDKHVVVQAGRNFRGEPKSNMLDIKRFKKYIDADKLRVYWIPVFPSDCKTTWDREIYQRNLIKHVLKRYGAAYNDFVILADVDEIPRRSVVNNIVNGFHTEYRLLLDKYSTAINLLTDEGNSCVRILPYGDIEDRTIEQIRRGHTGDIVPNGGWEFSSLGTPDDVAKKLLSFAHDELDGTWTVEQLAERMTAGTDLLGRDIKMTLVEIDDTFPEGIKNDREGWSWYEYRRSSGTRPQQL